MPSTKRSKFQVRSDAAKQRWVRDDHKESYWRKHIESWQLSGLSKRGYCLTNNLSASSFGAWVREIALREREYAPPANVTALLSETPVEASTNPFVRLKITPNNVEVTPTTSSDQIEAVKLSSQIIEILIPGGGILRLSDCSQVDFVCQLVSSLKSGGILSC